MFFKENPILFFCLEPLIKINLFAGYWAEIPGGGGNGSQGTARASCSNFHTQKINPMDCCVILRGGCSCTNEN